MIKLKALETFSLSRFNELKNIQRINANNNIKGKLYKDDIFECELDLAKYMLNETKNPVNRAVVKIIEIIQNEKNVTKEEVKEEISIKPKRTPRKRKTIAK